MIAAWVGLEVMAAALGAPADAELRPVKVEVPGAGSGEALVDGRLETAWRPEGVGLGQWVRLDFGREVAIHRIEVLNGDRGPDAYCAQGRAGAMRAHLDRGRGRPVSPRDHEDVLELALGKIGVGKEPLVTRTLTLTIEQVLSGYGPGAQVAVAEIRVFGEPAASPAEESGPVTCGSARLAELRDAVIARCATTYRGTRPNAECGIWRSTLELCADKALAKRLSWLPIAPEAWASGRLELKVKDPNPPMPELAASFVQHNGRWVAEALSCTVTQTKAACGPRHTLGSDGDRVDPELRRPVVCRTPDGRLIKDPAPAP